MATRLTSHLGKISLLAKNSRIIRDNAFTRLVESIERDPEFLRTRGIVVWQVPKTLEIAAGQKSVFAGQEGELVVIGGNQRCKAFMALGHSEVKPEWLVEAKDGDGNWWSPEKAERFVLLDNNPEGIAGSNDMKKLVENFSEVSMRLAGIDFSGFKEAVQEDFQTKVSDDVEKGEHGEKGMELGEFIDRRERSRRNLKEINETGFYLVVVFSGLEEKIKFVQEFGLTGDDGRVSVDGAAYLVLVFESYDQKVDFCEKAGLTMEPKEDEEYDDEVVYGKFVDGRAFAKKFGIELKESGLHFRDRKLDAQLADMAMTDKPQKSEKEIEETMRRDAIVEYLARKEAGEVDESEGEAEDVDAEDAESSREGGVDESSDGDGEASRDDEEAGFEESASESGEQMELGLE